MKTRILLVVVVITFSLLKSYSQTRFVKVNDTIRQFTSYQSTKIKENEKAPLLLNFHGSGMTALEHMMYTKTNQIAEEKGFIVVYPQGINNEWNVGFGQDYDNGTKDIEFINVLIEKLIKNYPIDSTKIYATGLSRGGFFVQRLATELPNKIKGFVSVGAPMPNEVKERIITNKPVKAMYVHGTADEIVKLDGKEGAYLSVEESISYWKTRNNIKEISKTKTVDNIDDGTSVTIINYGSVAQLHIENGGHTWPSADPFNVGFPLGKTTQDIDFNTLLYQFLFHSIN
ncbi:alpha/beta hydrolase family esterase [Xanthomarina sp. GH4-25]|uniref:alpha/beta hydrolase family esterase n=1 Tax=Xanthomarina sp. GH4-25 TaxID=3349335 RepID=UPI00387827E8